MEHHHGYEWAGVIIGFFVGAIKGFILLLEKEPLIDWNIIFQSAVSSIICAALGFLTIKLCKWLGKKIEIIMQQW